MNVFSRDIYEISYHVGQWNILWKCGCIRIIFVREPLKIYHPLHSKPIKYFFTQVLYCLIVIVLRLCHWLILANQVQLIHIYYKWCHYQGFFMKILTLDWDERKRKWNMINIITLAVTFDKKVTGFKLTKSNQDKKPLE